MTHQPRDSRRICNYMPRVFAYIIRTVGARYRLNGSVPWVSHGRVFFGPCKKKMRPDVKPGDYIMGISGSAAGHPRRILLWMRVDERLTFKDAYQRGRADKVFRALRGKAIHVRPRKTGAYLPGDPECYEHIPNAPHSADWQSDIRGARDVFLAGGNDSWVAESEGPAITEEMVNLLRGDVTWKGNPTIRNPLTENAVGKHVIVTGSTAQQIISRMPRVRRPLLSSGPRIACVHTCSCK